MPDNRPSTSEPATPHSHAVLASTDTPDPAGPPPLTAAWLLDRIAGAPGLAEARWLAERHLTVVLQPGFLVELLAHLQGSRISQVRLRMACYALGPALEAVPPQQLGSPGLLLALVFRGYDAAEFSRRYHTFLDAEFFTYAEGVLTTLRRARVHPDISGPFAQAVTRVLAEVARAWARTTIGELLTDLRQADPRGFLNRVVDAARRPLPEGIGRLAAMYAFYAGAAEEDICRAALSAWALDAAVKLLADLPAAKTGLLADVLRLEGTKLAIRWAEEARRGNRDGPAALFEEFARWLTLGPPAREAPAPYATMLRLLAAGEAGLDAVLREEPWLLHAEADRHFTTGALATLLPGAGGREERLGSAAARVAGRREALARPDNNPLLAVAIDVAGGARGLWQALAAIDGGTFAEPLYPAAADALLQNDAALDPLFAWYLAELSHRQARETRHPLLEAYTAISLAGRLTGRRSTRQIVPLLERAVQLGRELKHPIVQQRALDALGEVYATMGDSSTARLLFLQAFDAALPLAPPLGRLMPLLHLAGLMLDKWDFSGAALYLGLAERYLGDEQSDVAQAKYSLLRADLLWHQGDRRGARSCCNTAAELAERSRDAVLAQMVAAHEAAGTRPEMVVDRLREAAETAESGGQLWRSLRLRFRMLRLLDELNRDVEYIDEYARYRLLLDRAGAVEQRAGALLLRGRLLIKLGRPREALGVLAEARQAARASGQVGLLSYILPELIRSHFSVGEAGTADAFFREARGLAIGSGEAAGVAARLPGIGNLEDEVARIEAARSYGMGLSGAGDEEHGLRSIQALLAACPATAAIYLESRPSGGLAIVITGQDAEAFILPLGLQEVLGWLRELRLEAPRSAPTITRGGRPEVSFFNQDSLALLAGPVAAHLGERLWMPLREHLQSLCLNNLILIPDAFLAALPLHAATIQREALLDVYTVAYAPSAGSLAAWFGSPAEQPSGPAWSWSALVGSALQPGAVPAAVPLASLSAALGPGRIVWARAARLETLGEEIAGSSLLHIHLHAFFDPYAPERSALVLSREPDRRVTATEVPALAAGLRGKRLVVIAACEAGETALGLAPDFAGLPRAFLDSGAAAAIASPWRLHEPATSLVLSRFYRYLGEGSSIAAALRAAQLWLRDLSRRDAAVELRRLAAAARHTSIQPHAEASAAARLFEELALALEAEGRIIAEVLQGYEAGEKHGVERLWAARSRGTARGDLIENRLRDLTSALWRAHAAGAEPRADRVARLRDLLDRPYGSPYYWAGLQALGATL